MLLHVPTILDAFADQDPRAPMLVQGDRAMDRATVRDRTDRLAEVLLAAGVGRRAEEAEVARWESPHAHVALYLHNCPEYLEGMLGAWKAGATSFNVNYRYVADELAFLLDDASAAAVVVHDCFAARLGEVLPRLRRPPDLVLQVDDGSDAPLLPGAQRMEEAIASARPERLDGARALWSAADRYLCYTGGTTGTPKGTLWRQDDFLEAALGVRRPDGSSWATLDELLDAGRPSLRTLPAPPLMHGAAHWNALACWMAGGAVVLQRTVDRYDPADVLDTAAAHAVSALLLVGDPMARPLLDELRRRPRRLPSLRHVVSGGAVLSPATADALVEALPGVTVLDVLGSTESGRQAVATSSASGAGRFRPATSTVVLTADRSRRLRPGDDEVGWLAQTGRVPLGYLGHPERTVETFPEIDGVRHAVPGDRARWRADGTIELLGRDSVCINTGGEKVFAEEVEVALTSHPAVLDAVVCGRPSERFGAEVVAVVALRPGRDVGDAELLDHVRARLAPFKVPRSVVRVEQVVRSPSGKADYRWAAGQVVVSP